MPWLVIRDQRESLLAVENKKNDEDNLSLKVGAWNVYTLMDSAGSDRPQRRTALGRYRIGTAALSATRFAEVGEIKKVVAGYQFFWSERKSEERREAGVGLSETAVWPTLFLLNVSTALKGTHNYIFICHQIRPC